MEKNLTERETGNPRRFYLDSEANNFLNQAAVSFGNMPVSNVICALIRALSGARPRIGEDVVFNQLKRVFGREQFIAFLKGVAKALPPEAKPIIPHGTLSGSELEKYQPDIWMLSPMEALIIAYFAPTAENLGSMLTRCLSAKAKYGVKKVLIVSNDAEAIDPKQRDDLSKMEFFFVSLADMRKEIEKARTTKEYQKKLTLMGVADAGSALMQVVSEKLGKRNIKK